MKINKKIYDCKPRRTNNSLIVIFNFRRFRQYFFFFFTFASAPFSSRFGFPSTHHLKSTTIHGEMKCISFASFYIYLNRGSPKNFFFIYQLLLFAVHANFMIRIFNKPLYVHTLIITTIIIFSNFFFLLKSLLLSLI